MPVALNDATSPARRPSRPSFSTDASVTSAVTGPIANADAVPDVDDRADLAADHVLGRVRLVLVRDRDLPRIDDRLDLALAGVGRVDRLAGRRARSRVSPSRPARAIPCSRFAPVNDATNPSAGCATISCGDANWRSFAVDDHADPVGERGRVLVVVRDEQRRQPELAQQLLQLAAHGDLRVRVERRERLVEEQHARVARERAGERDPLALAAGELGRPRLGEMRDPEPLEVLVDPLAPAVGDVLAHVHVREERVLLEDEPDPPLVGLAEDPGLASRTRRRRRARSARTPAGRARRPRGARRSCPRPRARRARPCPRSRGRARARTTEGRRRESSAGSSGCRAATPERLRMRRIARLMMTSSALIASAIVERHRLELVVDRERQGLGPALQAARRT